MHSTLPQVMVIISVPAEKATELARAFVHEAAAACAQITSNIKSIYFWEGAVREDDEVLLFLKTVSAKIEDVKRIVASRHPYQVPELVVVPIVDGNQAYLDWIVEVTSRSEKHI